MNRQVIYGAAKAVSVLGLVLVSASAVAADGKVYPGVTCYRTSGGTLSFFGGTISNSSTTSELNVMCPILRDNAGAAFVSATMGAFDRNTTLDVTCNLCTELSLASPDVITHCTSAHTTSSSANHQVVGFSTLPTTFGIGNEYSYLTCSIPRVQSGNFSHIGSFIIVEN